MRGTSFVHDLWVGFDCYSAKLIIVCAFQFAHFLLQGDFQCFSCQVSFTSRILCYGHEANPHMCDCLAVNLALCAHSREGVTNALCRL